ncbi:hypothetical protein [Neorhodopirellula lusitana]|uniref:hypothetical protein n=1 Tax=Neorhodopirellula lusitana TaxID=445327 RepID=UPI00384DCCB3
MRHLIPVTLSLIGGLGISYVIGDWVASEHSSANAEMSHAGQAFVVAAASLLVFFSAYWPLFTLRSLSNCLRWNEDADPLIGPRFADSDLPEWIFPPVHLIRGRLLLAAFASFSFLLRDGGTISEEAIAILAACAFVSLLLIGYCFWVGVREEAEKEEAQQGRCLAWWQMDETLSERCRQFYHREMAVRFGKFILLPVSVACALGWLASIYHWFEGVEAWGQFGWRITLVASSIGGLFAILWGAFLIPNLWVLQQPRLGALLLDKRFCVAGYTVPISFLHHRRIVTAVTHQDQTDLKLTIVNRTRKQFRHHPNGMPYFSPERITSREYLIPVPPDQRAYVQRIQSAYQL